MLTKEYDKTRTFAHATFKPTITPQIKIQNLYYLFE